jgi:predicted DNA-binding protein (MmcQ/YjbR family)
MDHADIERLLRRGQFFITPYGRRQWVSVWADAALDWAFIADLVRRSYRTAVVRQPAFCASTRWWCGAAFMA